MRNKSRKRNIKYINIEKYKSCTECKTQRPKGNFTKNRKPAQEKYDEFKHTYWI